MCYVFWWGNLRERDRLEDQDVDEIQSWGGEGRGDPDNSKLVQTSVMRSDVMGSCGLRETYVPRMSVFIYQSIIFRRSQCLTGNIIDTLP